MPKRIVTAERGGETRIDRLLAQKLDGFDLDRIRRLLQAGRVRIRGKVAAPNRKLFGGEEIEVELPELNRLPRCEGPPIPVLYEDASILVVNKPPGMTVQHEDNAPPSMQDLLASQREGFDVDGYAAPGIVHRLDRETSGCLTFAKTDAAVAALKDAFEDKRIGKRYLALVLGQPEDAMDLESPYGKDPLDPRKYTTRVKSARRAALSFEVKERFADCALLSVQLLTGRTHQIRVQLSEAGHPVLADPIYGPREGREHPAAQACGRLLLHAQALTLRGLGDADIVCEAPLPEDFSRALELLRRPAG